jgi:hypothetical protein
MGAIPQPPTEAASELSFNRGHMGYDRFNSPQKAPALIGCMESSRIFAAKQGDMYSAYARRPDA